MESLPQSIRQDKGKSRAVDPQPEDEEMVDVDGSFVGGAPTQRELDGVSSFIGSVQSSLYLLCTDFPPKDRPATVDDILCLGATIRLSHQEMADRIVAGLRPQQTQVHDAQHETPGDTDNEGDDETAGPTVNLGKKKRKGRGSRPPWENRLSVCIVPTFHDPDFLLINTQEKIRAHMERLIPDADWMVDTVPGFEANHFDPLIGPCCHPSRFRLHLEGTTCNPWNRSAMEVFVEDFLTHHPDYPKGVDSVRDMVLLKTRATITSMIKEYRKLKLGPNELDQLQLRKNSAERKRGVSLLCHLWRNRTYNSFQLFTRRLNLTYFYPSLTSSRALLEELGVSGMSSDEEVQVDSRKEYHIRVPSWRSEDVSAWLRVFDILYTKARLAGILGDQRGALPRARVGSETRSTNPRFVTRLPKNAYDEWWIGQLVDYKNILRPRAPAEYYHTATTLQYFEFSLSVVICFLILLQACLWYDWTVVRNRVVFVATCCLIFITGTHLLCIPAFTCLKF